MIFMCVCLCIVIVGQVLALYDSMDIIDTEGVVKFTAGLQQADGSFTGDKWGKYNALSMLNIVYLYTCGLFVCR